jgi:hypothetical protein
MRIDSCGKPEPDRVELCVALHRTEAPFHNILFKIFPDDVVRAQFRIMEDEGIRPAKYTPARSPSPATTQREEAFFRL